MGVKFYTQKTLTYHVWSCLLTRAEKICADRRSKERVSLNYVQYWLDEADLVVVNYGKGSPRIKSFACVKDLSKNIAKVHLICGGGGGAGSAVMRAIEKRAREDKKKRIRLDAVEFSETFYRKLGYIQSDQSCDKKPVIKRKGNPNHGYRYEKCLDH